MKRTCVQCGKEFELTNSEIGFYKKRKLSLPKRCKECREQNRKRPDAKDGSDRAGNDSAELNRRVNQTDGSNRRVNQTDGSNRSVNQTDGSNRRVNQADGSNRRVNRTDGSNRRVNQTDGSNRSVIRTDGSNRSVNRTDRRNVGGDRTAAQNSAGNRAAVHAENVSRKAGRGKKLSIPALIVLAIALLYGIATGQFPSKDDTAAPAGNASSLNVTDSQDRSEPQDAEIAYTFRTEDQFEDHYEKHGIEMGFDTAQEYLEAANLVIVSPDALHKIEAEDGDDIYFLEDTNEFVVVSTDGYIRTYFEPEDGIEYYERQ